MSLLLLLRMQEGGTLSADTGLHRSKQARARNRARVWWLIVTLGLTGLLGS